MTLPLFSLVQRHVLHLVKTVCVQMVYVSVRLVTWEGPVNEVGDVTFNLAVLTFLLFTRSVFSSLNLSKQLLGADSKTLRVF